MANNLECSVRKTQRRDWDAPGILAEVKPASDEIIYAIKSHADYLPDCPRVSLLDKGLYACDELCGFITACALVRPTRLEGLTAKSVRKKMKSPAFAAAVSREDMTRGAEDFGVNFDEHIDFCIAAMQNVANDLGLSPVDSSS